MSGNLKIFFYQSIRNIFLRSFPVAEFSYRSSKIFPAMGPKKVQKMGVFRGDMRSDFLEVRPPPGSWCVGSVVDVVDGGYRGGRGQAVGVCGIPV